MSSNWKFLQVRISRSCKLSEEEKSLRVRLENENNHFSLKMLRLKY